MRRPARSRKAQLAQAPERWCSVGRAASEPLPAACLRSLVATPWEFSCRRILAACSRLRALRWVANLGSTTSVRNFNRQAEVKDRGNGSVMIVVATDAPMDARNLKRLAARAWFGVARTGSSASNGSGDYAIAFSTALQVRIRTEDKSLTRHIEVLTNDAMSPLFQAVIEATEEAVYNSMFRAKTMTGRGHTVEALPMEKTHRDTQEIRSHQVQEGELKSRLTRYRQIRISVIGRKSGHKSLSPSGSCWKEKRFLPPVNGSDTQWYRNVLKNPSIRIDARGEVPSDSHHESQSGEVGGREIPREARGEGREEILFEIRCGGCG